jgi:hypothetical protein
VTRHVRPGWLFAETTLIDWAALTKGTGAKVNPEGARTQLFRWALHKDLGLPVKPFTLSARPFAAATTAVPLPGALTVASSNPRNVAMPAQAVRVSLVVDTPSGALTLDAFDSGGTRITGASVDPGASGLTITLSGSGIARVRASGSGRIDSATYLAAADYANLPDWQPVEIVGLPVDPASAAPYSAADQGLVSGLTPPADAALQRLQRAGPAAGWPIPTSFAVPPWAPPDGPALVQSHQLTIVSELVAMLGAVPDPTQHGVYRSTHALPQPQNQVGASASSSRLGDSSAAIPPLGLLALSCHGDIYAALALGFATGHPAPQLTLTHGSTPIDYLVSVEHAFKLNVGPLTVAFSGELAAFFAPAGAGRPTAPGNLQAALASGGPRPSGRDQPRVSAVGISWDRTDTAAGSMAAVSVAIARTSPSGTPELLVATRAAAAPVPFIAALPNGATGDQITRTTFTDGVFPDPGEPAGTYGYLVSGQNRWGLWGDWGQAPLSSPAETAQQPLLVNVSLELADPASSGATRAAVLGADLSWDWHDRSPSTVDVVAAWVDASAPPAATPTALVFDPLASAAPLQLQWPAPAGAVQDPPTASLAGVAVTRLEPDLPAGDTTPPDEVGRYRVTAEVTADFSTGADVRVACWIRGTERFTGVTSDWTPPRTGTIRNPVPPVAPGPPGPITWASLADATGHSRAHLTWSAVVGAAGYVVYHADENALLAAARQPPPDLTASLTDRAAALDTAVRIDHVRDAFTRVTPDPVTASFYDVELPGGSQLLHGFVVLARSATAVESEWPSTPPIEVGGRGYTLIGIPRPRVPKAPGLAVSTSAATITVQLSAPTDVVERIDVHRTTLARLSGDVGTMGPPVSTLAPVGDAWPAFTDTVAPSWQPYWYRAVAWGSTDAANGWRTSPGPSSAVRAALVPPASAPAVTGASIVAASGSDPGFVTFSTDAPPIVTSLGRFRLTVTVVTTDAASVPAQAVLNTTLDAITPSRTPPAAGADPIGPAWLAPDGSFGVILNPGASTVTSVRISIMDPRGLSQPEPTEVLP